MYEKRSTGTPRLPCRTRETNRLRANNPGDDRRDTGQTTSGEIVWKRKIGVTKKRTRRTGSNTVKYTRVQRTDRRKSKCLYWSIHVCDTYARAYKYRCASADCISFCTTDGGPWSYAFSANVRAHGCPSAALRPSLHTRRPSFPARYPGNIETRGLYRGNVVKYTHTKRSPSRPGVRIRPIERETLARQRTSSVSRRKP